MKQYDMESQYLNSIKRSRNSRILFSELKNKPNNLHDKVKYIIDDFKYFDKHGDITNLFTIGYCFEFAMILKRNIGKKLTILWSPDRKHYVSQIDDIYYDINGEVNFNNEEIQSLTIESEY